MPVLEVPYPPSANKLWRVFRGRIIKSAAYRKWLKVTTEALRDQTKHQLPGRYTMELTVTRPDNKRRDLSNLLKATEDAFVQAGIIKDDSLSKRIVLQWSDAPPRKGGSLLVGVFNAEPRPRATPDTIKEAENDE